MVRPRPAAKTRGVPPSDRLSGALIQGSKAQSLEKMTKEKPGTEIVHSINETALVPHTDDDPPVAKKSRPAKHGELNRGILACPLQLSYTPGQES